jgi:hypothetical protein
VLTGGLKVRILLAESVALGREVSADEALLREFRAK